MRTERREFTIAVMLEIIKRATDGSGRAHCERCGAWCPKRADYEIDHVISEGIRPKADKERKLRAADGQLLCKAVCHREKTGRDVGAIGEAKRREAAHFGAGPSRPDKERKELVKKADGPTGMARRFK